MPKFENFWQPDLSPPLQIKPSTEGQLNGPDTIMIPASCLIDPANPRSLALKPEILNWLADTYFVCRNYDDADGSVGRYLTFSWFAALMPFLYWLDASGKIFEMRDEWVEEVILGKRYNGDDEVRYFLNDELKKWLDKNAPSYEFIQAVSAVSWLDIGPAFFLSFADERDHIYFKLYWR